MTVAGSPSSFGADTWNNWCPQPENAVYAAQMDHVWQWLWDRYGAHYVVAGFAVTFVFLVYIYTPFAIALVAREGSDRYVLAVVLNLVMVAIYLAAQYPFLGHPVRPAERWAAGEEVDRFQAMAATYTYVRRVAWLAIATFSVLFAAEFAILAAASGAPTSRTLGYAVIGGLLGASAMALGCRSYPEAWLRPARVSLAGDSDIGDSLPTATPTFAQRSNRTLVAMTFCFTLVGSFLATSFADAKESPLICVAVTIGLTAFYVLPLALGIAASLSLQPIRDLAHGAERVADGDYDQRVPVLNDDDLGVLSATFNRMQAGLAERRRLHSAFGTYVDPALTSQLLEQGDDVFTGEHRDVTALFIDVRDFTAYADTHTADESVARLNELFAIVVPIITSTGGHLNKFLGDGALAVFGAPLDVEHHADAAVSAAQEIRRSVTDRFGGDVHIGIGINTGEVIVGTIGGGGKLEYTLIGDAVNVAARVEQLTKTTGDTVLLTQSSAHALHNPPTLIDRGLHDVKGKGEPVHVYGLAD